MAAPLTQPRRIVVVGGGLAGAHSCRQLRRQGYGGELVLVSAERHAPYDRPPLSKEVLRGERDETTVPVELAELDVRVHRGVTATGLDLAGRQVHLAQVGHGEREPAPGAVDFDGLVIATGATPVTLPGSGAQHVLRTVEDARALRAALVPSARVVIVGASWIGAEVATEAVRRGCLVTCVEAGAAPAASTLGVEVGKRLASWWQGVELRLNTSVDRVESGAVVLADGTEVPADVVVVGIGARPNVDWLAGSGVELADGVVTDEWLRAAPGVVAVGDVANWWSRRYGRRLRVEHWEDAVTGSAVAARSLLTAPHSSVPSTAPPHDPVPYFWSDQFGHTLRYVGHHDPASMPIWRELSDSAGWSAAWLDEYGRLAAMLTVDRPAELLAARRAVAAGLRPDPDRLADLSIPLANV